MIKRICFIKIIEKEVWKDRKNDFGCEIHFSTGNTWNIVLRVGWSQPAITYSKLTIETLEQGVKYVQS